MKRLSSMTFLSFLLAFGFANAAPPTVERNVSVEKYMGEWYQIASIPQPYERICYSGARASYTLLEDGTAQVVNQCEDSEGKTHTIDGRAKIMNPGENSKLKVSFIKVNNFWLYLPLIGDYWIMATDYEHYALVGNRSRSAGYILFREPNIGKTELTVLAEKLANLGYDTCKFKMTIQEDSDVRAADPLCDYLK